MGVKVRRLEPCGEARRAEPTWRKPSTGTGLIAAGFFAAIFLWTIPRASAQSTPQVTAAIGDNGSITVPIASNPLSFSADNVTVTIDAPPGLDFQVQSTALVGPSSVAPGATVYFQIDYVIGPNAQSGTYELKIHPVPAGADTYTLDPDANPTLDTEVGFTVNRIIAADAKIPGGTIPAANPFGVSAGAIVYDYTYASTGPYPGDLSSANKNPVRPGPLELKLTWSSAMAPSADFLVQLAASTSTLKALDFKTVSWSKKKFDNDTWTGTTVVPDTGYDGPVTVLVNSSETFITMNMQDVTKCPSLTLGDGWTEFLGGFQGANASPVYTVGGLPSSPGPIGFFLGSMSGEGLTSLSVAPLGQGTPPVVQAWANGNPINPSTLYGAQPVTGAISVAAPGAYVFKAVDVSGLSTEAKFTVVGFDVQVNTHSRANYTGGQGFSGTVAFDLTSSAGLEHYYRYDTTQPYWELTTPPAESLDLSGTSSERTYSFVSNGQQDPDFFNSRVGGLQGKIRSVGGPSSGMNVALSTGWATGDYHWINPPAQFTGPAFLASNSKSFQNDFHLLPGAIMKVGPETDPVTHYTTTFTVVDFGVVFDEQPRQCGSTYYSPDPDCTLAMVTLSALDGEDVKPLYDAVLDCNGVPKSPPPAKIVSLDHGLGFLASVQPMPGICDLEHCLQTQWDAQAERWECLTGYPRLPHMSDPGAAVLGVNYAAGKFSVSAAQFSAGSGQTMTLGAGVKIAFNAAKAGSMRLTASAPAAEAGWSNIPNGLGFSINAGCSDGQNPEGDCFDGPLTLTVPLSKPLTAQQQAMLKASKREETGQTNTITPISIAANSITFSLDDLCSFRFQAPVYDQPVTVSMGGASLLSGNPQASLNEQDPSSPDLRLALARMLSQGKTLISAVYRSGPVAAFSPAAALKLDYSTAALQGSPAAYQFSADGEILRLPGQSADADAHQVTSLVSRLDSYVAVFADTVPVALADLMAPKTKLALAGTSQTLKPGLLSITSSTLISLVPGDPSLGAFPVSGPAASRYFLDQPLENLSTAAAQAYTGPFSVGLGTHTLIYYSEDSAGNLERFRSALLLVSTPAAVAVSSTAAVSRLAAALDPSGRLWKVEYSEGQASLSRYAASGSPQFSTNLPDAAAAGDWSLGFDGSGNAYALQRGGLASRLYEVSPQGALLGNSSYPALPGQALAADSDGSSLWVAGRSGQGAAALWRAQGASLDFTGLAPEATAQAVLADGTGVVWVAGDAGEAALWRYDSAGGNIARFDWTNLQHLPNFCWTKGRIGAKLVAVVARCVEPREEGC